MTYVNTIANVEKRIHLSKLRLSNHELMIEKGRHQALEISQRNCPFCPGYLEDEAHFIFYFSTYSLLCAELFAKIEQLFPRFQYIPIDEKMKALLSDINLINPSGTYIQKATKLRKFILNKHKNTV